MWARFETGLCGVISGLAIGAGLADAPLLFLIGVMGLVGTWMTIVRPDPKLMKEKEP